MDSVVPQFSFSQAWDDASRKIVSPQFGAVPSVNDMFPSLGLLTPGTPGAGMDVASLSFDALFASSAVVGKPHRASDVDVISELGNLDESPVVPGSPHGFGAFDTATVPHGMLSGVQPQSLPEYTGPLPSSFHDLTEVQIATISFKNFTKLMAKAKLTDRQVNEAKKLRRRVKNRVSARLCSTRKRVKCVTTETSNYSLNHKVSQLTAHNENLLNQHMLLQERCIELQKSDAQHTREKLFMEAENQRLRALLEQATAAGLTSQPGVTSGLYAHAA